MSGPRSLGERYFAWFDGVSHVPLVLLSCAVVAAWALRVDFGGDPEWLTDLAVVVGLGPLLALVLVLPYFAVMWLVGLALAFLDGLRGVDEDEVA